MTCNDMYESCYNVLLMNSCWLSRFTAFWVSCGVAAVNLLPRSAYLFSPSHMNHISVATRGLYRCLLDRRRAVRIHAASFTDGIKYQTPSKLLQSCAKL